MNDVSVDEFLQALQGKDDTSALSLLETGRITINSRLHLILQGAPDSIPVFFFAIQYAREDVTRALIRLGATLDEYRTASTGGDAMTPAALAVRTGNVASLALCHRLGANLSVVCGLQPPSSSGPTSSAIENSFEGVQPASLAYLLDNVYPARPIVLSKTEERVLSGAAIYGARVKPLYQALVSRGYDFKTLEGKAGYIPGTSCVDHIVSCAQKSGDADLLRYVVKDLGLVSKSGGVGTAKAFYDLVFANPQADAALDKYECAVCDAVGVTKQCSACKVVRYCSKECSKRHWLTGGHREECKDLKRAAAAQKPPAAARNV